MSRKICYITGTRADFGLMKKTLDKIHAAPELDLSILVTGMHLLQQYGHTLDDIISTKLPVRDQVAISDHSATGAGMAINIADMIKGFIASYLQDRPDVVLLLGDRGEMLAGAIAAAHLNIPVAHIHGGERSGTIDEPVRHAISKFAHIHFVSTQGCKERLIKMGELENNIFVAGAPGLDGIAEEASLDKGKLCQLYDLVDEKLVALFLFHPVLQEAGQAKEQATMLLEAVIQNGFQVLALKPNSDSGSLEVINVLEEAAAKERITLVTHLPRNRYLSWLKQCDLLVGNSSSGIIEAGSFGTPVVNVGSRQNLRERNDNVMDVAFDADALTALIASLRGTRFPAINIYGQGTAGPTIVDTLTNIALNPELLEKVNSY